jgi:hypothetical protein
MHQARARNGQTEAGRSDEGIVVDRCVDRDAGCAQVPHAQGLQPLLGSERSARNKRDYQTGARTALGGLGSIEATCLAQDQCEVGLCAW